MRDKKYITRILNELGRMWESYPDITLGELIVAFGPSLFYNDSDPIDDDELISIMKTNIYLNLLEEYKNGETR